MSAFEQLYEEVQQLIEGTELDSEKYRKAKRKLTTQIKKLNSTDQTSLSWRDKLNHVRSKLTSKFIQIVFINSAKNAARIGYVDSAKIQLDHAKKALEELNPEDAEKISFEITEVEQLLYAPSAPALTDANITVTRKNDADTLIPRGNTASQRASVRDTLNSQFQQKMPMKNSCFVESTTQTISKQLKTEDKENVPFGLQITRHLRSKMGLTEAEKRLWNKVLVKLEESRKEPSLSTVIREALNKPTIHATRNYLEKANQHKIIKRDHHEYAVKNMTENVSFISSVGIQCKESYDRIEIPVVRNKNNKTITAIECLEQMAENTNYERGEKLNIKCDDIELMQALAIHAKKHGIPLGNFEYTGRVQLNAQQVQQLQQLNGKQATEPSSYQHILSSVRRYEDSKAIKLRTFVGDTQGIEQTKTKTEYDTLDSAQRLEKLRKSISKAVDEFDNPTAPLQPVYPPLYYPSAPPAPAQDIKRAQLDYLRPYFFDSRFSGVH